MPAQCPLCGSVKTRVLEAISTNALNLFYRKAFGVSKSVSTVSLDYCQCDDCDLRFFNPLEAGSEELYIRLQQFDWYYLDQKPEYLIAQKYLPGKGGVLEIGAGKAVFADFVGIERYTGLEFNDSAISRANGMGVVLLKESVEHLAKSGKVFDAVVSFQVLEHVADARSFIQGCIECLKPGGILILAVPSESGFVGKAVNNLLNMPSHHLTRWTDQALENIARLFPLEVVALEHEPVSSFHKNWAHTVIWNERLRKVLHFPARLFDIRFSSRVLKKFAAVLGFILPPSLDDLGGHTVVAVYRKKQFVRGV